MQWVLTMSGPLKTEVGYELREFVPDADGNPSRMLPRAGEPGYDVAAAQVRNLELVTAPVRVKVRSLDDAEIADLEQRLIDAFTTIVDQFGVTDARLSLHTQPEVHLVQPPTRDDPKVLPLPAEAISVQPAPVDPPVDAGGEIKEG